MKTVQLFSIVMLIIGFTAFVVSPAAGQNALKQVEAALRSGNSAQIATHMSPQVDVTILNVENSYSRTQAEMVLKKFFEQNQPSAYRSVHQGSSSEGSKYVIGQLNASGKEFSTYVYAKLRDGNYSIREIRIEEQ